MYNSSTSLNEHWMIRFQVIIFSCYKSANSKYNLWTPWSSWFTLKNELKTIYPVIGWLYFPIWFLHRGWKGSHVCRALPEGKPRQRQAGAGLHLRKSLVRHARWVFITSSSVKTRDLAAPGSTAEAEGGRGPLRPFRNPCGHSGLFSEVLYEKVSFQASMSV